jgi:hypothetical protein
MKSFKKRFSSTLFILLICIGIASCQKKSDPSPSSSSNNNNNNSNTTSNAAFYFVGTFGGSPVSYQESVNGFLDGAFSSSNTEYINATNTTNYYYYVGTEWSILSYVNSNLVESQPFTIAYNYTDVNVQYSTPSYAQVNSLFPIAKSTAFSVVNSNNSNGDYTNGWLVTLQDVKGINWSTATSPATQTNSYVTLTSKADTTANGEPMMRVKGSLSCTLYDSVGTAKVLTGNFVHLMVSYNSF